MKRILCILRAKAMKSPIKQGCYLSPWLSLVQLDITDYNYRSQTADFPYWQPASLVARKVKNPLVMQDTCVWSLGQEDLLEKELATLSSVLTWGIPWTEVPGGLYSMWLQRVRHEWDTLLCNYFFQLLNMSRLYYPLVWCSSSKLTLQKCLL